MTIVVGISAIGIGINNFDVDFAMAKSVQAFDNMVSLDSEYAKLQQEILGVKQTRIALRNKLNKVPAIANVREIESRLRHYAEQNKNLKNGELPTKFKDHGNADRENLLILYKQGNNMVIEQLKVDLKDAKKVAKKDRMANIVETDLQIIELELKQLRAKRNSVRRQLKPLVNQGDSGIVYKHPTENKIFSTRLYTESS